MTEFGVARLRLLKVAGRAALPTRDCDSDWRPLKTHDSQLEIAKADSPGLATPHALPPFALGCSLAFQPQFGSVLRFADHQRTWSTGNVSLTRTSRIAHRRHTYADMTSNPSPAAQTAPPAAAHVEDEVDNLDDLDGTLHRSSHQNAVNQS